MRIQRRNSKLIAATIGSGLIMAGLAAPTVAQAVSWGALQAKYGSQVRAESRGTFVNEASAYAKLSSTLRTRTANKAYTLSYVYWYYSGTYNIAQALLTVETTSKSYVTKSAHYRLDQRGERARAKVHTCEQTDWWVPDVCSGWALPTFSY